MSAKHSRSGTQKQQLQKQRAGSGTSRQGWQDYQTHRVKKARPEWSRTRTPLRKEGFKGMLKVLVPERIRSLGAPMVLVACYRIKLWPHECGRQLRWRMA